MVSSRSIYLCSFYLSDGTRLALSEGRSKSIPFKVAAEAVAVDSAFSLRVCYGVLLMTLAMLCRRSWFFSS